MSIVAIAICAVICGAGSWVDLELYGQSKQAWFSTFLSLDSGIPSHDTFARVFARVNPEQLQACFSQLDYSNQSIQCRRSHRD